jgi:PHD/YefM family antitoxin component YafN of YafNO toxin-antitoxin module
MTWNIAQAKQQFSEVVRLSVQEPQAIYNRDKPVAMLVNAELFEEFHQCHTRQHEPTLSEQFSEIRTALQDARLAGLELPARSTTQRSNAFVEIDGCGIGVLNPFTG